MGVGLLTLAKNIIEKIVGGFKSLAAMISSIMAGALQKVRNGLSGLGGFELFGKKVDLIPNSVINALDSRISTLKNKAADTAYSFTALDGAIGKLNASISANAKNVASAGKEYQAYADKIDKEVAGAISNLTSKNDALAAIRKKNHDYNIRDIADYQAYNEAGKAAANVKQELAKATETASDAIEKTGGAAGKAGKKLKGMGDDAKKAAKETSQAAKMLEKAKKAMNDAADGLFAQLFPGRKLLLDMQKDAQTLANVMGGNATEATEKYGLSVDDVAKKSAELNKIIEQFTSGKITKEAAKKAFDDMKKGIEGVKDASKDASKTMQEQFKRAVESIDQSFADMWKNLLSGGEVSFKSLADNFKNIFAEVLHSATTKPLTNAIMDSITGEVTSTGDKPAGKSPTKTLINTFKDGFDNVSKVFQKQLNKLITDNQKFTKALGDTLTGAMLGYGVGAVVDTLLGTDHSALGGAIGGAIGTAIGAYFGNAQAGAGIGSMVGTIIGALVKHEDPTSRAWMRADGTISHRKDYKIDGDVTLGAVERFWKSAKTVAANYGVEMSNALTSAMTYKREKDGTMAYYFDLFDDANLDAKRDGELYYHSALRGEDAEDAEKIVLAMAQMQIAALKQADWSGVSDVVAGAMAVTMPESLSSEEVSKYFGWIDDILLAEKLFGTTMDKIGETFKGFGGTLSEYKAAVDSAFSVTRRLGASALDDVSSYLAQIGKTNADITAQINQQRDAIQAEYDLRLSAIAPLDTSIDGDKDVRRERNRRNREIKAQLAALESWYSDALFQLSKNNDALSAEIGEIVRNFDLLSGGMELLKQTTSATGADFVALSQDIIKSLGGAEKASEKFSNIFKLTASETHQAGIAYQSYKYQIDALNRALGFSGDSLITTTDQLYAWVSSLDPASDAYAEQINLASEMATAINDATGAGKLFTDAIAGINATISGVISNIKEDMMSEQELYTFRKSQAEELAASIAQMTDVSEIRAAADEASKLVSNMWRSLSDAQKSAGTGNWMLSFLDELKTLSTGRIKEIQNEYGANNQADENYEQVEQAAINMTAIADASKQQAEAGEKQLKAADNMNAVAALMDKAASAMNSAANLINRPVDVDVTVHQVAVGGEIN